MKLYTIGFTKKTAEEFMNLLVENEVTLLIDTRLNNISQLSGYAKGADLKYFLKKIGDIDYIHEINMAPNDKILQSYRKKEITWVEYEFEYIKLLEERDLPQLIEDKYMNKLENACVLCSEDLPDKCHRRLLVEYIKGKFPKLNIEIRHLI